MKKDLRKGLQKGEKLGKSLKEITQQTNGEKPEINQVTQKIAGYRKDF